MKYIFIPNSVNNEFAFHREPVSLATWRGRLDVDTMKKKKFRPEFVNSRRYRHLTLCPGNLSFESSRTNNPYNFRFLVFILPFLPFFPPPLFSFRFLFYLSIPSISFSFPDDVLFITVVVVFFLPEKSAFHEWRFYAHKFHWTGQQKDLYISRVASRRIVERWYRIFLQPFE